MMGFAGTCAGFGGVVFVNHEHLSVIPTIAFAVVGIMIGAAWAWMMSTINARVLSKASRSSKSQNELLFRFLFGLDFVLVLLGSTIAWALIPVLKMIHVFV